MYNMRPPGRGHFWPQGHNMNKLTRGPLGDATYEISRLYMQLTGTISTIIIEGYIRIIPAKFGQNPASSLGGGIL